MSELPQSLRAPVQGMPATAVLAQAVTQLVGVGIEAEQALRGVGVHTILDLGASALFALARQVAAAADGSTGPAAAAPLPADMLDDVARGRTAPEVARGELSQLRMLNTTQAKALSRALAAPTVRDLGLWPPALAAHRLVQAAAGASVVGSDPQAPSELQPRMGQLPVDRLVFHQLYFECLLKDLPMALAGQGEPEDSAPAPAPDDKPGEPPIETPIGSPVDFGPKTMLAHGHETGTDLAIQGLSDSGLDLSDAVLGRGFEQPGVGLRVAVAQTWTPVALSLGHLLHSVALAPGEATRIAVIDWSRTVTTDTDEGITETEKLDNALERNRSVSEVTQAVASEMQEGSSRFDTTGASWGIGAGVAGSYKGVTGALNFGYSRTDAKGSAFSNSSGQRDVSGELTQKVQDRTQQAASLSRGRRASVVSEVGVKEAERLSTRVVANYNHMHALSVLYFEVVQLYRTRSEAIDVEPLLYLPVRPFDFDRAELVERYRGLLAEVALNDGARAALLGIAREQKADDAAAQLHHGRATLVFDGKVQPRLHLAGVESAPALAKALLGPAADFDTVRLTLRSDEAALVEIQFAAVFDSVESGKGPLVGAPYTEVTLQGDAEPSTQQVVQWANPKARLEGDVPANHSFLPYHVQFGGAQARLGPWALLQARCSAQLPRDLNIRISFVFKRLDSSGRPTGDPVAVMVERLITTKEESQRLLNCSFEPDTFPDGMAPLPTPAFDLGKHLRANALYYTMALLRRADPALLGMELGRLTVLGRPLLSQVDPVPLAHAGNYLVFRWSLLGRTPEWRALLERRGLLQPQRAAAAREALVPLASGGVFAEAVLGRFNSAEKLDLTRFWNWQDSPIPLVPTEIAPLQAGARQGAEALVPGSLGAANLRQQEAPALPDPGTGMAEVLKAATQAGAFRDMSGLNSLLTLGGQAMALSAQGAREFMGKAMDTVSAYGARVNHGRDMDERAVQQSAAPGQPGGGKADGGQGGGGSSAGGAGGRSNEGEAFAGPGANNTEAAAEVRPPRLWTVAVEVREPPPPVPTDAPKETQRAKQGPMAVLDGLLLVSGLPTDKRGMRAPDGTLHVDADAEVDRARVSIVRGSGLKRIALEPDASETLVPRLRLFVERLNNVGPSLTGDPLPFAPDHWDDFLPMLCAEANFIDLAIGMVTVADGATTRVPITFEWIDRLALKRQLELLGAGNLLDHEPEDLVISLKDMTGDEDEQRKALETRLKAECSQAEFRHWMRHNIVASQFSRPLDVVVGIHMHHDAATKSLRLSFTWIGLSDLRVVGV